MIAHDPLHGSGRAALPHPALALGDDAHATQGIGMTDRRKWQPTVVKTPLASPEDAAVLAAPRQRAMPEPPHLESKKSQRRVVHGHSVIPDMSTHHRLQPLALVGDGFVHTTLKLGFHLIQLRLQSLADRLPQHRKPSITPLLCADMRPSRPGESHPRPLTEPDVNLSIHPARATQGRLPPSAETKGSSGFPLTQSQRGDPTPSLQPHYEPSSLLRVGPPQCSASVRSPRGFRRLGFSLRIRATGSCSSTRQPDMRFTPPLRRSPSAQSSGTPRTCPRRTIRPWFRRLLSF